MKLWKAEVTTTVSFYVAAENELRAHIIAKHRREDILDPDVDVQVDQITSESELGDDAPEDYPLVMNGEHDRTIAEMLGAGPCPHGVAAASGCPRCLEAAGQQRLPLTTGRGVQDAGAI